MRVCLAFLCLTYLGVLPGTRTNTIPVDAGQECVISQLVVEEGEQKCEIINRTFNDGSTLSVQNCSVQLDLRCYTGHLYICTRADPPACNTFSDSCTKLVYTRSKAVQKVECDQSEYVGR